MRPIFQKYYVVPILLISRAKELRVAFEKFMPRGAY